MPDQFGFDHLGDAVRCIDCPTGGPIWQWREPKRRRHARTHGIAPNRRTTDVRRRRSLLAAPPTTSNEEKEATTMASKTTSKGEPAKHVAIDILRKAGQPLQAEEIAKRVLASGRCVGLKGKTPETTISAMLAVGSKPGGAFARVDKGTYTLANDASTTTKPTQRKPTTKRTPARKQAAGTQEDRDGQVAAREALALEAASSRPAGAASSGSRSLFRQLSRHRAEAARPDAARARRAAARSNAQSRSGGDRDPLVDLKRQLAAEVPSGDNLLAAPKLVAVVRHRRLRPPLQPPYARGLISRVVTPALDGQ